MIMATAHQDGLPLPHADRGGDPFLLDALYCEEERLEDDEGEYVSPDSVISPSSPLSPIFMLDQDLFWEDGELLSLFLKEKQQQQREKQTPLDFGIRDEAVDWVLKVTAYYGFKVLTAVLAINYIDRFLFNFTLRRDSPWMLQLVAVACLSLAAKVEETQAPLLLDLQVVETKYLFEAKTIQRMELLVLSTLGWKMHPVTAVSFLDHIVRRLGLRTNMHWDFLQRCERRLLSLVSDSRFVDYLPSVLATATMMNVIDQVDPLNSMDYHDQLLDVLRTNKDEVKECYDLIRSQRFYSPKRKLCCYESMPNSPCCVIDSDPFGYESSNDSWASIHCSYVGNTLVEQPPIKKMREQEETKIRLNRAIVASP